MKVVSVGRQDISVSHFCKKKSQYLYNEDVPKNSDSFVKKAQEPLVSNPSFKKINKNKLCDGIAGGIIGTAFAVVGFSILGPLGALILGGVAGKAAYESNNAHIE